MNRAKSYTRTIASACMSMILTMCVLCFTAYAATATFNVNVPPTSVAPGDTVEISVNITPGDQTIADYSYSIKYDQTLLSYVSGGTDDGDGTVSYSGTGTPKEAVFTFKAIAAGTASIETAATDITSTDGETLSLTPAYNSITISDQASANASTESASVTDTETISISADTDTDTSEDISTVTEDEVGTLTESGNTDSNIPDGTVVTLTSSNNTYYIMNKPDSVSAPDAYIPAKVKLNDVDVRAYIKSTSDSIVLLYASNSDGNKGWYFFDTKEGTFMNASDIIDSSSSGLDKFMSKNKFVIMLIAIIVLVILIVVIVMLAVSLKGLITDYEAQIDKLKKDNDSTNDQGSDTAKEESHEPIRITHHENGDIPTINNKALFPGDEEIHESYEDSDYDNQVVIEEEDFAHTDDYDDSAFSSDHNTPDEDLGSASDSDEGTIPDASTSATDADSSNENSAFASTDDTTEAKIKASLDEIDAALESAKKYQN